MCAPTCTCDQIPEGDVSKEYRSTRFLQFELASSYSYPGCKHVYPTGTTPAAPLVYETGDHAVILPENEPCIVDELCKLLQLDPNQWFTVTGDRVPFALPAKVNRVLSQELDLAITKDNIIVSSCPYRVLSLT